MIATGYNGSILHIDLAARRTWVETPDENFWRIYAGGGLLATALLLRDTPAGLDAFDPRNLLIFTSSVVAGHPFAGLARFTVASKSPLTGGIGEARVEGPFGMALKRSGYDTIVLHGAAGSPTIVEIDDGRVVFRDAGSLWGAPVSVCADALGAGAHTAIIGPAGENRVRFASVVTDRCYQAARMGMGAVMGSKLLKALVIRGGKTVAVADAAACERLTRGFEAGIRDNPLATWQLEVPGFSAWVHTHGIDAALCVRNYRESVFEHAANYRPELFLPHYRGDGDCPGCPNHCIKLLHPVGAPADSRSGGIHQEVTGALGPNCGVAEPDVVLRANVLCNELGMDPCSLGFTISMAMECAEHGMSIPLRFGDGIALLQTIDDIAYRRGALGNLLAEGVRRAAEALGGDAANWALHVKGLEMVPFEPRTQTNLALGYAVAPVGPRYDICEHDWDYDTEVGWPHSMDQSRTVGILERVPMQRLAVEKVPNCKALMTLWSGADALDFCIFAVAPTRVLTLEQMSSMLAAVTGWRTSSYEIMRYGERRLHLMRVYNLREGHSGSDDILPARFFDEAITQGKWAGTKLDRAVFADCVQAYYRMMGWDGHGVPLRETLIDHRIV